MPLPNVQGMFVHCKTCAREFSLGALNARLIGVLDGSCFRGIDDIGWLCRCDRCGAERRYRRHDFYGGERRTLKAGR